MKKENSLISLVGYRGSGKTTIGRMLAKELNIDFIDIDSKIEEFQRISIKKYFEKFGEAKFRELETKLIIQTYRSLQNTESQAVISLGGGAILNLKNYSIIKSNSVVIFLNIDKELVYQRINDGSRPPLTKLDLMDEIKIKLMERMPIYQKIADAQIDLKYDSIDSKDSKKSKDSKDSKEDNMKLILKIVRNFIKNKQKKKLNYIVLSLRGKTIKELIKSINKTKNYKDFKVIEIRADFLNYQQITRKDLEKLRNSTSKKLIFTLRNQADGGLCKLSDSERAKIIIMAIELKFDFIDIELSSKDSMIKKILKNKNENSLILSYHNFQETNLKKIKKNYQSMLYYNPDIIKIVTMAKTKQDWKVIKKFQEEQINKEIPITFFCTGKESSVSRISGHLNGNAFTYLSISANKETAPDQLTYNKFQDLLRKGEFNERYL